MYERFLSCLLSPKRCDDITASWEKAALCIWESKAADQLRGNRAANQRLCFRYKESTLNYYIHFKPLAILCGCAAGFVLDVVGNPEDRVSLDATQ